MKKSIKIAALGLAAFGAVAAPALGASAAADFTDTLEVTITNNCAFTRKSGSEHAGGDNSKGTWAEDTLSGTFTAGELDSDFGTSNFHVVCNNLGGWKVTAEASALAGADKAAGQSIGTGTPAANTSAWSFTPSKGSDTDTKFTVGAANATEVAKMTEATAAAGKDFSVKYAVSVSETQAAGKYTGTIAYTFAQL